MNKRLIFLNILLFYNIVFCQKNEENHSGHESKSADLDHDQDHDLAEHTPLCPNVSQGKTCHAGGRCSGEKCVKETGRMPVTGSYRYI